MQSSDDGDLRVTTNVVKDDGSRAVGTALDADSEAAKALAAGRDYSGQITLFNRLHMATYLPVAFDNGPRGAVFVGVFEFAKLQGKSEFGQHQRALVVVVLGERVLGRPTRGSSTSGSGMAMRGRSSRRAAS